MQNGRENRRNWQLGRLPSVPIYRRLEPQSTRGVLQYAARTASEIVTACVILSVDTLGVRGAFSRTRGVRRIGLVTPPADNAGFLI